MVNERKSKYNNLTLKKMLEKLNELYDDEAKLIKEGLALQTKYEQLVEDKEFLQTMIMYSANKNARR